MKKILLIAAVALCAMGCCKKADNKCGEKQCCKDSVECCQKAAEGECCQKAAEEAAPVEEAAPAEAPVEAPAAEVIE